MEFPVPAELAPTGKLRAGINFGNTVLVRMDPRAEAAGIAVDLSRELARRANLPLELVTFATAGSMAAAVRQGAWDVSFLAAEPERAQEIIFSPPYLEIDTTCLVFAGSSLQDIADIDRPGIRVVVSTGSAYDLFLSRTLRQAELVRAPSPSAAARLFLAGEFEALAGIRPMLEDIVRGEKVTRVLKGRFSTVRQAVGVPGGRNFAAAYVRKFVEEIKASPLLADIIARNGVSGVSIATET